MVNVGAFLAQSQECPLLFLLSHIEEKFLPPLLVTLIRQRGEELFFEVGQQKKPKGYKGHP